MRVIYIVVNENTLAYADDSNSSLVGVLAGSVAKGGYNPKDGPISISRLDHVRLASVGDFNSYRVDARGHLK